MSLLPFLAIIVIMYFLMIRPQVKKQKNRQKMIDAIQKGDNVVTTGGIHGKVMGFTDNDKTVILKVDDSDIPLGPFVQNMVLNTTLGMVSSLKGVEKPKKVELMFEKVE